MTSSDEDAATQDEYLQEVAYFDTPLDTDLDTICNICHAEFLDAGDLDIHMQQVHVTQNTKTSSADDSETTQSSKNCQFCDSTYQDLDVYARHIAEKHLKDLIACGTCTKCFTDEGKARRHEKRHNFKSMFACTQCKDVFATQTEVSGHEFVFHNNIYNGQFIPCLPHLSQLLKFNALQFLQSKDRVLECHSCQLTKSATATDIKSYLKHLNKGKCVAYVCDMCCYTSNDKKTLIKHLKRKNACKYPHDSVNKMTMCVKCKKSVHCKEMAAHLNACNNYNCTNCNIQFDTISALSAHQSEYHPVELDVIKCRFCSKEYVGQSALDKHTKRAHSHQFPLYKYACKSCEGIFKHPQALFSHYFGKHKDLLPYTCKICNKKFRVRKRFTIHIKLEHKGAGAVEFDENYHVFFANQKSEKPFVPKCVIPEYLFMVNSEKDKDMTTEVETEVEDKREKPKNKPKARGRKRKRTEVVALSSSEEEVESLLTIKKRAERKCFLKRYAENPKNLKLSLSQRKQITCKVCNKYCYTVQNYQNHIKIHTKNRSVVCIKCSKSFKTKNELTKHVNKYHATSKLIETLKNVLERKQGDTQNTNDSTTVPNVDENFENLTPSERFMRTVKKVKVEKQVATATIAPTSGTISVKNFFETFIPDPNEGLKTPKTPEEEPVVTIKEYDSPFYRKRSIKLTRFIPQPPPTEVKLRMPEKFKSHPYFDREKVKLSVRLVNQPIRRPTCITFDTSPQINDHNYEASDDHHNDYEDKDDIPEVAHEVMLEGTDEPPKPTSIVPDKPDLQAPHKIVIPKLPDGYKKIHIATLQPQAPYFKIITVKNEENTDEAIVIDPQDTQSDGKERQRTKTVKLKKDIISLPDGTKFVSANPLEHLLGDRPVEELLQPIKNKYYRPQVKNIKGLLADALQNLDNASHRVRKKKAEQMSELRKSEQAKTGRRKYGPTKPKIKDSMSKTSIITVPENSTDDIPEPDISTEEVTVPEMSTEEITVQEISTQEITVPDSPQKIKKAKNSIPDKIKTGKSLPVL